MKKNSNYSQFLKYDNSSQKTKLETKSLSPWKYLKETLQFGGKWARVSI